MHALQPAATVRRIAVLIIYRDPLMRAGLVATLSSHNDFDVSVSPDHADQTILSIASGFDVVVADYDSAIGILSSKDGNAKVVDVPRILVVTARDGESDIQASLQLGVQGYLLLGCRLEEICEAVRALHNGLRHIDNSAAQRVADSLTHEALTTRESEVLELVAHGYRNKSIASELCIGVGTVKSHMKAMLGKLGASTRTEAAAIASRRGLIMMKEGGGRQSVPPGTQDWRPLSRSHNELAAGTARD